MKQVIKFSNKDTKQFLQIFLLQLRNAITNVYKRKQNKYSHIRSQQQNHFTFIILLLLGIIPIVCICIWKLPELQASDITDTTNRIKAENSTRGILIQGFSGIFLFTTAYLSWRNLQATQEKQVTERFAKAIEQLGSENIHVRLGAIYALERIAKDSDKDYWQVMEILTAYVRERTPYPPRKKDTSNQALWFTVQHLHKKENYLSPKEDTDITPIGTDIKAVLTVIERRTKSYERGEIYKLDLNSTDLSGANLHRVNLSGASLYGVNLNGANLNGANLSSANLSNANLNGANLSNANLNGANLSNANLNGANLNGANLNGANLSSANLSSAGLHRTNLSSANLNDANLSSAGLSSADLSLAYLIKANLSFAYLINANLSGAILKEANLSDAMFYDEEYDIDVQNITIEQIKQCKNWEQAVYSEEFFKEVCLDNFQPILVSYFLLFVKKGLYRPASLLIEYFPLYLDIGGEGIIKMGIPEKTRTAILPF